MRFPNSDRVAARERELEAARAALEREGEEHRQAGVALERALARGPELADDAETFGENERAIAGLRSELKRRELLIERRTRDLEAAEHELERARYGDARAALADAAERRQKVARAWVKVLSQLNRVGSELREARAAYDEAESLALELLPASTEFELPDADEPAWPELEGIAELLQAGPTQPKAAGELARRRGAEQRRRSEDSEIAQAVEDVLVHGMFDRFERLPDELRPRALTQAQRRSEQLIAGLAGEERQAAAIRRRLERLRQPAADPQLAA